MASRTIVTVLDDIDNSEGASTVTFTYGGTAYEIDLNEKNQAAFDKAIAKYIGAARKVGRGAAPPAGRGTSASGGRRSLGEVRTWARQNGFSVSDLGRVPREVQQAYDAAH